MANNKIDPASPFYLGSGDQPDNLITHVILKVTWFVDGTISKPTEKKKMLDCETVNSMLVFWILKAIEPKLAASIPYFEEAKKLWVYLEKRFCEANGPRLQQLHVVITGYVVSNRPP
ncbi:uncharacterized protein LOC110685695 [Chenopodium quinoa]|uniref:uncharacterized protein LOC110685695 n=1 Tax=Chenopodium quinoa TaxID=63459 RepID=UPI000B796FA3|nr:uncharacterized protein LOC110685695 [Chenopodium quinoa]